MSILFLYSFSTNINNLEKLQNTDININDDAPQREKSSVEIADLTLKNTVVITMLDKDGQTLGLGSGVIIDDGMVITNVHVIENAKSGYVQKTNSNDKIYISGYFAIDRNNDIVLLSVPDLNYINKIVINETYPLVGEKIYVAGNPEGFSGTFSEGLVSAIRKIENNNPLIQISAPISPGSSGGAVVNSKGELIGIAVGGFENGQNLNFAIPATYVKDLIANANFENVTKLNLTKSSTTNGRKEIKSISDLVSIRSIVWETYYVSNSLVEFSIYNQTNNVIKNVLFAIIIYDSSGIPVDYETWKTPDNITILPGLSKQFSKRYESNYRSWIKVRTRENQKAVFRILDYTIVK
jgi:hypothetical protein